MPAGEARAQARVVAGRYRLLRELGRGGMGVVWLADDQLVDRRVAVKELRPPAGLPDAEREVFGVRALREARSAARIRHPNAVILYDVLPASTADDAVYLIMEYVDGPTLAELVRREGVLPGATVALLGRQVLDVLEAAHGLGIVHRDIKPGNLIIAAGNQVKLTDFGIAHTLGSTRLTHSGTMGTPAYMAPELFSDRPITPAADLWSVGATLYYAVEGRGPFDRDTTAAAVGAILVEAIPVPRCSPGLAEAISGMLRRDPAQRATIAQARTQLQAAARLAPDPVPDPNPAPEPASKSTTRPPAEATTVTRVPGRFALGLVRAAWVACFWGGGIWALYIMGNSYNATRSLIAIAVYLTVAAVATIIMVKIVRRLRVGATVIVEVRRQRVRSWRRAWRRARP
jgi:serine/threonine protein kinase